jgi:GGDEF domain-containing protein
MFRLPVILLLLVHAAFFVVRIPLAGALPLPADSEEIPSGWWTFTIFEGVFFAFCIPYLLGAMARERMVLGFKHASLIDPLTGVGNRRAFFERGEKLLHRSAFDCRPTVLLLFDPDSFKHINDTFGHHVGDWVLRAFCGAATAALRPDDLFGRLGGEEFASLLPHTSLGSPSPSAFAQTSRRQRWRLARIHWRRRSASEWQCRSIRAGIWPTLSGQPIGLSIVPRQTGATVSSMRVAYPRISEVAPIDGKAPARTWLRSGLNEAGSLCLASGTEWAQGSAGELFLEWNLAVFLMERLLAPHRL